ncbi:oligosaccharide flippase family protein [Vagococcus fluvialis]|uniref:oligosaccharide flippase family protein n=1 Tax=Vagococcus fluvialis TaxID=2738 RepID=UPI003B5BF01D
MKKKIIKLKDKDNFIRPLLSLVTGSMLGQIITILISPVTTRLFSPSDFGFYTMIVTAVSIFGPIISLKYDMVIVNTYDKVKQTNLIVGSFIISLIMSFFISFGYYYLFLSSFSKFVIITLFLLLLTYGVNNILISVNNFREEYTLISKVTVTRSLTQAISSVSLGLLKFNFLGLLYSQILSQLNGCWKQSKSLRENRKDFQSVNFKNIRYVLKDNLRQPFYNSPSALLTTFTYSSINLFLGYLYGAEILGFYSLSYRMLGLPFMIISANVARVFFKHVSNLQNDNQDILPFFYKIVKILSIIIIPSMILLYFIAPTLFSVVFGKDWYVSGEIVQTLIPMFTLKLIIESMTTIYIVKNKQNIELILQFFLLIGQIILFIVAYFLDLEMLKTLQLVVVLNCLVYIINLIIIFNLAKGEEK